MGRSSLPPVILVFLRNLTSTVIISVAIPLSIMVTFIVLYFTTRR